MTSQLSQGCRSLVLASRHTASGETLVHVPRATTKRASSVGICLAKAPSSQQDGIVGTISHPQPYYQLQRIYGPPHGGTNSSYNYPSPNPLQGNPYPVPNITYAYSHPHQWIPGLAISPFVYPNVSLSPYY